jgi:hypothetical protein
MAFRLKQLFYITHIDNLESILDQGILSHQNIEGWNIKFTPIYDRQIVSLRRERIVSDNKNLWQYANLYFQPRNPMMYRVTCEKPNDEIAVIAVDWSIVNQAGVMIAKGNAASSTTDIVTGKDIQRALKELAPVLSLEWWKDEDGSKRRIMAECLVPDIIPPEFIKCIYVSSNSVRTRLFEKIGTRISIIPEPHLYFGPSLQAQITPLLSIMKGDMFFSRMHTLTVSVNTVGIMGKGLASRAKYQFPDVYVYYQDLCRKKILRMGKPFIYKRESSFDYQLADNPQSLKNENGETWFLLFATKSHWREDSNFSGIEKGMQWLLENYTKEGIKSLGIPALGCGLGNLKWDTVGPMLCKYLSQMEIPVQLFLPAEKEIIPEQITSEFLL